MEEKIEDLNEQEKSLIELVFDEVDVDNSGELSSAEFSTWWVENGGDKDRLETVQQAFEIISMRDGKPGCSLPEFREVSASPSFLPPFGVPLHSRTVENPVAEAFRLAVYSQ